MPLPLRSLSGPRQALCIVGAALAFVGCQRRNTPQKTPDTGAETSAPAGEATSNAGFAHTVEQFADIRLLRYQVPGFDALNLKQRQFLYYLYEASLSGRDILYDQRYSQNLLIRRSLEAIVASYGGDRDAPAYQALLTYAKRVWFSNGIHHHYSNKKFVPEGLSQTDFKELLLGSDVKRLPLAPTQTVGEFAAQLTQLVFDRGLAESTVNKAPDKDPVRDSANHFYVGLTRDEVVQHMKRKKLPNDATPVSYGLNTQLVKLPNGTIEERPYRVGGLYDAALRECVRWLEKAQEVADTPEQAQVLAKLIAFYRSGDLRDWDAYSIAWVKETQSPIDLIHGFIETYSDPMDMRGSYEALLQLEDREATKRIRTLSQNAQWFEDHSPIAQPYKKKDVVGISARVIQAVVGAGDAAPAMPSGVNLPNAHWIREKHGSKSITLGNIVQAYEAASRDNGVLEEFAFNAREIARAKRNVGIAGSLLVDMHEVIGHASGMLAEGVDDPSVTLGHYASTLEEARADLVALYFLLDPKLVALNVMPSLEVGRSAYDSYIRGGLLVQIARVPLGERLEEAHMQNRQLVAKWADEQGKAHNVIERVERDNKTYVVVRDYVRLRELFGQLLAEIQRIKSEGDLESARELVEGYGTQIDPDLHKQIRERYQALKVAPYAGFIQPELIPVKKGDEIVDVRIEYPTDFVAQQLRYAARYSFLPTYNGPSVFAR